MNIKKLMFLKAASAKQDTNLLNYSDLVNKTYSGAASTKNVRTEGTISVTPGAAMILTGPTVSETDIRFYDENGDYQSANTITKYNNNTASIEFTVPNNSYAIRPMWYLADADLTVETFIASNPVIKYA